MSVFDRVRPDLDADAVKKNADLAGKLATQIAMKIAVSVVVSVSSALISARIVESLTNDDTDLAIESPTE